MTELSDPGADRGDVDVEIWGPPGAGTTVLLASLYETLDHLGELDRFTMGRELADVHRQLVEGQGTPMTRPSADPPMTAGLRGEQLSVVLHAGAPGRRVRVVAGDDLRAGAAIDADAWAAGRAGKVVVACFNPFLLDAELAWKGFRHLTAVLQGPGLGYPLEQAVTEAAYTLLHVEADVLRRRAKLHSLLSSAASARLTYDGRRGDPDRRFDWDGADPHLGRELTDDLRRFAHEQVRLAAPLANVVRRGLRAVDDVAVVLTHVDLAEAVLPSVTSADFERVFADVFSNRPLRRANQQVLARPFQVEVSTPYEPSEVGGAVTGRLRPDGAAGVVTFIRSMLNRVAAEPSPAEWRLRTADQRLAEATAELDRERSARATAEAAASRLQTEKARAADGEPAAAKLRDLLAENRAMKEQLASAQRAAAEATPTTTSSAAELAEAARRFEDLRQRTHEEIVRRDESIQQLGEQVRTRELQLAEERNARRTAEKGGIGEDEVREREVYEAGRTGPGRLWAAIVVRAVPAVPVVAAVVAPLVRAAGGGRTVGQAFVLGSGVGLAAVLVGTLFGVWLYWRQVGPRWVWLRSRNDKAGLFDVLTSTGQRVQSPPREFTLEVSPVLELLGVGTVRRAGTAYATTEPDAWRAHLDRSQVRRRWAVDVVTVVVLVAWAAAVVVLAA